MEENNYTDDQAQNSKDKNRVRLSEIPLTSVKVDLLYYNTTIAKFNHDDNALHDKSDKKKIKPSPGMLFMPLYFNVKKVSWENMWIDFMQQSQSVDGLENGQNNSDSPQIDEQQKERIIYEQTKSKMTSLRKEKEKKENEFDNFNATFTDLKKEQLIFEIKNKMLEQMIADKKEEYEQLIDNYYKKTL